MFGPKTVLHRAASVSHQPSAMNLGRMNPKMAIMQFTDVLPRDAWAGVLCVEHGPRRHA